MSNLSDAIPTCIRRVERWGRKVRQFYRWLVQRKTTRNILLLLLVLSVEELALKEIHSLYVSWAERQRRKNIVQRRELIKIES